MYSLCVFNADKQTMTFTNMSDLHAALPGTVTVSDFFVARNIQGEDSVTLGCTVDQRYGWVGTDNGSDLLSNKTLCRKRRVLYAQFTAHLCWCVCIDIYTEYLS